jgi:F-type H+-transporting ATPase subunit delta
MKISKEARRVSRQLFRACLVDGAMDEARARQVVEKVSTAKPRGYIGILEAFARLVRGEVEKQTALVESATELDASLRASLQQSLNTRYNRNLVLQFQTNPGLLGGIRVRVGSDVWDGSVKGRLDALRASLA